ncbi:hypothetical protein L210DRAFT_3642827 [Boletus edulis BED1]|uniref:Telomere replication protein EST3 n=1 Tax=Boletus edulis BED1 TaxID=1328754 RepID=A0AAD4C0F7_BOLED|nr:hypothetical protein L210DRAFT_3642827 [Boletus edulis BED1]
MSESMSNPWIRDYIMNVAETFGAQLYNAPVSSGKKKVQLTDFLTYQENSYVWAWISDKDYKVSVRISKDAADQYKSRHMGRNLIDCRFSVVTISNYRPMFSPRPLGSNTTGNTPIAHISLEISQVKLVGIGGHLFGNPRDLELNENVKEWVLGLLQDGGGGNVLKLRKQEENKKAPLSPPSPPPFSLYAPVSQCQATKTEHTVKPKPERPEDFKRAYTKRWRIIEADPRKLSTKFATKPAAKDLNLCPLPPHRTPSPTSGQQRQGTPSDWSPSNRGSPVAPDAVTTIAVRDGIRQHDEPTALSIMSNLDTEEHTTVDTAITSDTRSLQPPTPAQRIRHSPPRSNSPSRSSPGVFACSSPLPCQQLSCSFPPPLSSPLSLPSSSLPVTTSIRKNIQRKVPHPGSPVSRPDPTKQGPVQILVPNSDTGSSQPYPQSQQPSQSQSQQRQHQLLPYSPAFPSSLARDFEPPDTSTPKEGNPGSSTRHTSRMFAESIPTHCDTDENDTVPTGDRGITEKADANLEQQGGLDLTQPPAPSLPRIEVLEIGTSDPEEETDELQLTRSTARTEVGTKDMGKGETYADREDDQRSIDKVEAHPATQNSPPHQPSCLLSASFIQQASLNGQGTDGVPISSEHPGSQGSMHSLFSDVLEDERTVSPRTPVPVGRPGPSVQEKASPAHVPRHDAVAWKEPSFLARNKGKGKARAVEEPDTPSKKAGRKRRHSTRAELPRPKRVKVATPEMRRTASGQAIQPPDIEASTTATGEIHAGHRPSTPPTNTTPPKPRLANFAVEFERIDLMVDLAREMRSTLLRTGRIRTLGQEVVEDGRVYIKC